MISVIICTYNRSSSLGQTLESLDRMSVPPEIKWEVIVVDNNSSDDTRAVVDELGQTLGVQLRYIFEAKQGKSHALNAGIQKAQGEIIAFTDDDMDLDTNWLSSLQKTFDDFNCLAIGGRIKIRWDCPKPDWLDEQGPYALINVLSSFDWGDEVREIRTPPVGCNMAVKKEAFARYGLFRTDLGRIKKSLIGCEETEFFLRLIENGERIVYAPAALAYHIVTKERTERAYFETWHSNAGISLARMMGSRAKGIRYFGVPRHLFRSLLENLAKWIFARGAKKRFFYRLQLLRIVSQVAEMRRLSKHAEGKEAAVDLPGPGVTP